MGEHIFTIKALLSDVLLEFEYLSVYATFQSNIALCAIKTRQKHTHTALQNSKTHAGSWVTQILWVSTHRGDPPSYITSATTILVVALQQYDRNNGQITLNKEVKTIHEWQHFTN